MARITISVEEFKGRVAITADGCTNLAPAQIGEAIKKRTPVGFRDIHTFVHHRSEVSNPV